MCVACHYKGYCARGLARCQYDIGKPGNPKKCSLGMHPFLLGKLGEALEKGRIPERTLEEQHHF